jgi:hypothetical protein
VCGLCVQEPLPVISHLAFEQGKTGGVCVWEAFGHLHIFGGYIYCTLIYQCCPGLWTFGPQLGNVTGNARSGNMPSFNLLWAKALLVVGGSSCTALLRPTGHRSEQQAHMRAQSAPAWPFWTFIEALPIPSKGSVDYGQDGKV